MTKVENKINIDRIEELLEKKDVENIVFTEDEINQNEYEQLKNIEVNEDLFKIIENALTKRINNFFEQEKKITIKNLTEKDNGFDCNKDESHSDNEGNKNIINTDNKDKDIINDKDKDDDKDKDLK